MWYHIESSTYAPLRGARFIALTALNREDQEHLTNRLTVLRPVRLKQGKIRLPWHEKADAFPCQGQTHSFLIRAALESKTSSASRVNGLQADFALRDFAFLEALHQECLFF
ncbi:hypothetical protein [Bacillus cereus]|uniref:hypothetical protein n=1 Tax=Bacillus cereus group TaxID=86661 RepID=UPI003D64843C